MFMKSTIITLINLTLYLSAFPQFMMNPPLSNFIENAEKATIYVEGVDQSNSRISGTGFLIDFNDYLYFVTAQHVAYGLKDSVSITMNDTKDNIPKTVQLKDIMDDEPVSWTFCDSADVAVLPIPPESSIKLL